jgi:hypothetical protein
MATLAKGVLERVASCVTGSGFRIVAQQAHVESNRAEPHWNQSPFQSVAVN